MKNIEPRVQRPCHLSADRFRSVIGIYLERSGVQARDVSSMGQRRRHASLCEEARELAFNGVADAVVLREAVQHELLDVQLDVHVQLPTSDAVSDFSNLVYSV